MYSTFLNADRRFFLGTSLSLPLRAAGALESRMFPPRDVIYDTYLTRFLTFYHDIVIECQLP